MHRISPKNMLFGVLFSVAALMLFSACPQQQDEPPAIETVKIGVIYPLSGSLAATGEDLKAGAALAADIVNRAHSLSLPLAASEGLPEKNGTSVELVFGDSENDASSAAEEVERLVREEKVAAIMGAYSSTITLAAGERAEMLKIPFLNATSTSPILTQRGLKWFFRTTPDDEMFAENFFTFFADLEARRHIDIPRRLVLVYENRLWGTSVSRAERRNARKNGYAVAGDIPYDQNADTFDAELSALESALPAVLLQTSYSRDAILLMKGYKARNLSPAAILGMNAGFISPSFAETLGPDAEYVLSREVWASDLGDKKPLIRDINDLFIKQYGRPMTGNSARAFTGLLVLADAVNRARSFAPSDIRNALLETDIPSEACIMPWQGIRFDADTGQNLLGKGIIVQMLGGAYHTVWPWEYANRPVVWPMPSWAERP